MEEWIDEARRAELAQKDSMLDEDMERIRVWAWGVLELVSSFFADGSKRGWILDLASKTRLTRLTQRAFVLSGPGKRIFVIAGPGKRIFVAFLSTNPQSTNRSINHISIVDQL